MSVSDVNRPVSGGSVSDEVSRVDVAPDSVGGDSVSAFTTPAAPPAGGSFSASFSASFSGGG